MELKGAHGWEYKLNAHPIVFCEVLTKKHWVQFSAKNTLWSRSMCTSTDVMVDLRLDGDIIYYRNLLGYMTLPYLVWLQDLILGIDSSENTLVFETEDDARKMYDAIVQMKNKLER